MRRFAVLALVLFATAVGCRRSPPNYAYSFHKDQISQDQLFQDEQSIARMRGVVRVTPKRNQDGSATLEVECDQANRIEVQEKLSALGYTIGLH